jgi:hypothetical protein
MTDLQLYPAIGIPIVANATAMLLGFTLLSRRVDDIREDMREIRQDIKMLTGKLYELMDRHEQ